MGLLLYKSNEMFSATELIRKSKMIFDKIIEDEIDKAIILRDGKPSFLLMDFEKYEKIMAEFEDLKQQTKPEMKSEKKDNKEKKKKSKNVLKDVSKVVENVVPKPVEKMEVKVETIPNNEIDVEEPIEVVSQKEELIQIEEEEVLVELSEEEEINNAFLTIENMNFNDDMKKEAQDKIRIKILQARKERAELLAAQEQELQKEDEEELQLKQHIEEEKIKKQRELKEFWD